MARGLVLQQVVSFVWCVSAVVAVGDLEKLVVEFPYLEDLAGQVEASQKLSSEGQILVLQNHTAWALEDLEARGYRQAILTAITDQTETQVPLDRG